MRQSHWFVLYGFSFKAIDKRANTFVLLLNPFPIVIQNGPILALPLCRYRVIYTSLSCSQWECNLVPSLWELVWRFLLKLKKLLPHDQPYHSWVTTQNNESQHTECPAFPCLLWHYHTAKLRNNQEYLMKMMENYSNIKKNKIISIVRK